MLRRFCLLAGGLALAGALIAGCGGSSKSSNANQGVVVATVSGGATTAPGAVATKPATSATASAATARPGTTPAPAATAANAAPLDPAIASVVDNFAKVKSWRAKITYEGGANNNGTVSIEAVSPDKSHFTTTSSTGMAEVIIIGSDTYVKFLSGWVKQAASASGATTSLFDPKSAADGLKTMAGAASVAKGGTDSVNGKSCQLYTWTTPDASYQACIADGLPQRVITQTTGATPTKTTIVFTDYNAAISIVAPI